MLETGASLPVEKERLGYAVHAVVHRHRAGQVLGVGERQAEFAHELLRRLSPVLNVHADDDDSAVPVLAPVPLQDRRLLVAGGLAPRRPEIQDDNLSAVRREAEWRALERREPEGRRRPPDERGGDVARVDTEPVGEQRQHGEYRERDQPAPEPPHAGVRRSGRIASSAPSVSTTPPIQIQLTRRLTWSLMVACVPSRAKSPRTR